MRRFQITAALMAVGLLAIGSIAFASAQFTQSANITLTATKAGKSTGFKANLQSSDPGAPNAQPQGLKTLTITFPKKTKFNFKSNAIAQCKAGETEIKATGGAVCPSKSKIGTGTANANGAPVIPSIPERATAYAGKNEIIFLLAPTGPAGSVLVLFGKVSGNRVTTGVPAITLGPVNVVITALQLTINKIGGGKQAFVTAGNCTSGKFKVKSEFLYQTGAQLTLSSSSKCSK
ncbi:MAG TPA: hypothetical protein VID29_07860 [Solirubrobacteraceae bacterium]|jgi:hypothetical protein